MPLVLNARTQPLGYSSIDGYNGNGFYPFNADPTIFGTSPSALPVIGYNTVKFTTYENFGTGVQAKDIGYGIEQAIAQAQQEYYDFNALQGTPGLGGMAPSIFVFRIDVNYDPSANGFFVTVGYCGSPGDLAGGSPIPNEGTTGIRNF